MDADDNRYNGCELKINQGKCPFGSCENHGAEDKNQCGSWRGLYCDKSTENQCCVFDGPTSHDEAVKEASSYLCGSRCHMYCHKFSDNYNECKSVCKEDIFGSCGIPNENSNTGSSQLSGSGTSDWSYADIDEDESNQSSDDIAVTSPVDFSQPIENSEGSGSISESGSGCVEWGSTDCFLDKTCWVSEPMAHLDGGKIRHDLLCGRLAYTPRVETPGRDRSRLDF